MDLIQRQDIVASGTPTRQEIDACKAAPWRTNISRYWIGQLDQARKWQDEADQLTDVEPANVLVDLALDIEDRAREDFSR